MEFSGNAIWLIGQRKIANLKEYTSIITRLNTEHNMRSTWERKEKKNVPPNAEEIPLGWVDLTIYKNISDVCFVKPQALACLLYEFMAI